MGLLFLANRNYSNLSHPSPLVIPTNGRDLQCAPRISQILPGKRPGATAIPLLPCQVSPHA